MSTTAFESSQPASDAVAGVPGMLITMTVSTFLATALICLFVEVGGWWLMALTLGTVFFGAGVVLTAVGRALGDQDDEDEAAAAR